MAAAAGLAVTLIPVLIGIWCEGAFPGNAKSAESQFDRNLSALCFDAALCPPKITVIIAFLVFCSSYWPLVHLGAEFMPPLDEGDLLYMPTTLPGLSAAKAAELLQPTDRMIATVPEVETVFVKLGAERQLTRTPGNVPKLLFVSPNHVSNGVPNDDGNVWSKNWTGS